MTRWTPVSCPPRRFLATAVAGAVILLGGTPSPSASQTSRQDLDGYLNHAELTRALQDLTGLSAVTATWIVTGSGTATLTYRSDKGGVHRTTVELR